LTEAGLISGHPSRKPETHPEYLRLPTAAWIQTRDVLFVFFLGNLDLLEIATKVGIEVPRLKSDQAVCLYS